jgi:hypothetical protein
VRRSPGSRALCMQCRLEYLWRGKDAIIIQWPKQQKEHQLPITGSFDSSRFCFVLFFLVLGFEFRALYQTGALPFEPLVINTEISG